MAFEPPLDLTDVIHPCDWRTKTRADVEAFLQDHGEQIAQARGAFVQAVEAYGKIIKLTGAAERRDFSVERFLNTVMDSADPCLAEEVSDWLGAE